MPCDLLYFLPVLTRYARLFLLTTNMSDRSFAIFIVCDISHAYFPLRTGLRIAFLASSRCMSGTLRVQFGYKYARTVWLFWNKIDVIDSIFPLFPYLLIYRTAEAVDPNPARSIVLPCMENLHHTGYYFYS